MNDQIKRIQIPFYKEQINNITDAVKCGQLVYGPHLTLLEEWLAKKFNKRHVLLTSNGFAALFLSLKAAVQKHQKIMTTPASTCSAMVNAIKAAGHEAYFSDMDLSSASLSEINPLTQNMVAIVPDHFGVLAPMCKKGLSGSGFLIEDACQSFISRSNQPTNADVVVVSFYPTKLINGIDGGAILTDDCDIYERAKKLHSYGDQYQYEEESRFNFKMNNINAAVALGTLTHLDEIGKKMMRLYEVFCDVLENRGIRYLKAKPGEIPSKMLIFSDSLEQKQLWVGKLKKARIECGNELIYVCPKMMIEKFPEARKLVERTFSIPFHPLLKDQEISTIKKALGLL